jgi:hypothetical protein
MMPFRTFVVAAILGAMSLPSAAEDALSWGHSGNWRIKVDQSLNNGCFMIGSYQQGEILRVGVDKVHDQGYIMLTNSAWRSLEVGMKYKLTFKFDDEPGWGGTFTAVKLDTTVALVNYFTKSEFLKDLASKQVLAIYFGEKPVATLPLTGTFAAVQSLAQCQAKVNELTASRSPSRSDPFASGSVRPAVDPFQ